MSDQYNIAALYETEVEKALTTYELPDDEEMRERDAVAFERVRVQSALQAAVIEQFEIWFNAVHDGDLDVINATRPARLAAWLALRAHIDEIPAGPHRWEIVAWLGPVGKRPVITTWLVERFKMMAAFFDVWKSAKVSDLYYSKTRASAEIRRRLWDAWDAIVALDKKDAVTTAGVCRVCGCTDDDCRQCIARTGEPCHWVEPGLCSACAPETKPR